MNWVIKALGIFFIVLTGAGFGFLSSMRLSLREKQLSRYEACIEELKTRLYFEGSEKERLLKEIFCEGEIEYFDNGAVKISDTALLSEDKKILEEFFWRLGSTEREGEVSRADMCLSLLARQREKAAKANAEKKDLYKSLGICCGIFGSILII